MDTPELVIWSAMLGGLATLATFALADALIRRRIASWRAFVFVALIGTVCLLLTGLMQVLFPDVPQLALHVLQNSLGLLSGALALSYLGLWMGQAVDDRIVRITLAGGTLALVLAAGTMATLTLLSPPERWHELMLVTAIINGLAILPAAVVSLRAVAMGDQLAWGILGTTGLLAFMVAGLYARAIHIPGLGTVAWTLTAISTVAFFMLGTYLGLRRDRVNRQLERLASLAQGADPATGLPQRSMLLSKVDDAIWRSARLNQECTVICLHLQNLYELSEIVGHHADQQILSAMSARIRRSVGFRHVVGLYHPRCFVVVISTYNQTRLVEKTLQRLRYLMNKPLQMRGLDDALHTFTPRFGFGSVVVTPDNADLARLIDQAERLSLAPAQQTNIQRTAAFAQT
ncbi:MAG: GGDEF domain-containing protein [Burkholderiales bacterium]|nr:GGDEF domain-containing protein [Burkholderiales bacterium]